MFIGNCVQGISVYFVGLRVAGMCMFLLLAELSPAGPVGTGIQRETLDVKPPQGCSMSPLRAAFGRVSNSGPSLKDPAGSGQRHY